MNNRFDELTKSMTQSVTRRGELKEFSLVLAGVALMAALSALPAANSEPAATSTLLDPASDAVFPYLYDAPVPAYLDVVEASVNYARGVFHLEIKVSSDIPANADPGLSPAANHLGATFGILTDLDATGAPYKFFGQPEAYHFNFLIGALYSVTDSGAGLSLGWTGFILTADGITEIPLKIKQDTFILEVRAAALGNPTVFEWAVATECDPVPLPEEDKKSALLVDYVPDRGVATWRAPAP